jgi:hypothetical protein
MELKITLDDDSVVQIEPSGTFDLFSLIVMAETAHQMLMSQYLMLAAAKVDQRNQFKPKLLIPTQG